MRNSGWPPILKSFFSAYVVYLGIFLGTAEVALSANRDYFVQNWSSYRWIVGAILLLPFLLFALSIWQGGVAKWFRLFIFSVFRVEIFAVFGLVILTLFTITFLRNLLLHFFQGEQIFLNVLFLNLFFMFFLSLVLANKFQVKQPSALLIRKKGDPRVYLFENGVIRHIPDRPTLRLLGYSFDEVVEVGEKEFSAYTQRPAIESASTARLVQVEDEAGKIWMIFADTRKWVPDSYTLHFILQLKERPIETVTKDKFAAWKEISPLISLLNL